MESVWIVKVDWLIECFIQWKRAKEEPHLLDPSMKLEQPEVLDENAWKTMDDEVDAFLNDLSEDEDDNAEQIDGEKDIVGSEKEDPSDEDWLLDIEQEIENELEQMTEENIEHSSILGKRKFE
jgi:hypothetical protein